MKYFQLRILVAVLGLLIGSCNKTPTPVSEENDDVARAYKLIDADRPSEAIDLLEPRFQANPKRLVIRTALASAYAARAGIRVPRFAPLVVDLVQSETKTQSDVESEVVSRIKSLNLGSEAEAKAQDVLQDVLGIADLLRRFDKLPDVQESQSSDLRKARSLLDDVPENDRGVRLYRAVIGAVEVRYTLKSEMIPRYFTKKRGSECQAPLKPLARDVLKIAGKASVVVEDLSRAMPEQIDQGATYLNDLKNLIQSAELTIKNLDIEPRVSWPCN